MGRTWYVGPGTRIDGFAVSGGFAREEPNGRHRGERMLIYGSGPTIARCRFEGNSATEGGAAAVVAGGDVGVTDFLALLARCRENRTSGEEDGKRPALLRSPALLFSEAEITRS